MKKEFNLIQSYLLRKYFISTAYRSASTPQEVWYFETIVWECDSKTNKRGKMLLMEYSGMHSSTALRSHFKIIDNLKTN